MFILKAPTKTSDKKKKKKKKKKKNAYLPYLVIFRLDIFFIWPYVYFGQWNMARFSETNMAAIEFHFAWLTGDLVDHLLFYI